MTEPNVAPVETPVNQETPPPPAAPPPQAAPPQTSPPEKPQPDPKELRRQVLAAKLQQQEEAKRNRKATTDFEQRQKQFEQREAELATREARISNALKDPIKGFQELGIKPEQLYQLLTDHLIQNDTPEHKQKQVLSALKEEIDGKYSKELEELRKQVQESKAFQEQQRKIEEQRAARAYEAERGRREAEMKGVLKADTYEDLHTYYDDDQLINVAYQVAEKLNESGLPYDYETVAKKMLEIHRNWLSDVEKKKNSKKPAPTLEAAVAAPTTPEPPKAVGNKVASETAGKTKRLGSEGRTKFLEDFLHTGKK